MLGVGFRGGRGLASNSVIWPTIWPINCRPGPGPRAEPGRAPDHPSAESSAAEDSAVEPTPAPEEPVASKPGSAKPGSLGSRIKNRMGLRKTATGGNDPVAPVRRDSTLGGGGKMRSLDRPAASGEKKPDAAPKGKRREPRINVKMASLPEVAEPQASKPAAGEPKAQKPDVKLSKDVIAGHRQGMRAPLEELAKEEKVIRVSNT